MLIKFTASLSLSQLSGCTQVLSDRQVFSENILKLLNAFNEYGDHKVTKQFFLHLIKQKRLFHLVADRSLLQFFHFYLQSR